MALSEWIGNKQKSIQKAVLKKTLFSESVFLKNLKIYVFFPLHACASQEVFPYLYDRIYIFFAPYIMPFTRRTILKVCGVS